MKHHNGFLWWWNQLNSNDDYVFWLSSDLLGCWICSDPIKHCIADRRYRLQQLTFLRRIRCIQYLLPVVLTKRLLTVDCRDITFLTHNPFLSAQFPQQVSFYLMLHCSLCLCFISRCTSCCAVTTNPEEWRVAITNIHTTAASPPRTRTTHTDHTPSSPLLCLSPPPCIVKSQNHSVVRAANDNHHTKLLSCRVNPHLMKLHISFSIYTPPNLLVNDSLVE